MLELIDPVLLDKYLEYFTALVKQDYYDVLKWLSDRKEISVSMIQKAAVKRGQTDNFFIG